MPKPDTECVGVKWRKVAARNVHNYSWNVYGVMPKKKSKHPPDNKKCVELNKLFRFIIQLAIAIHGIVVVDGSHGFGHNEILLHFLLCLKEGIQCQQSLHPLGFLLLCIPIIPQHQQTTTKAAQTNICTTQKRKNERKKERQKKGKKVRS